MNRKLMTMLILAIAALSIFASTAPAQPASGRVAQRPTERLQRVSGAKPRNVIFVLADDHRYDAMGFLQGQKFIETPRMDAMARNGVHLKNAFVTTALCSPSRASILTGLYAHQHKVVDNNNPVSPDLVFFPQYLKRAGYQTAFIGKWHMGGESDDPQRGFDHWVSFRGQGTYLPSRNGLNINGKQVPQKGYITDELTDYAIEWLDRTRRNRPFFLYLSHKAVHAEFVPAERHQGRYRNAKFDKPRSMNVSEVKDAPMWVQNQRNSWHGVDFPYHSDLDIEEYYKRYAETLLAVDESLGRLMEWLKAKGLYESTLVIYMGDNGFAFGEHGLIDKRTAYEESMRVPMLMQCPELFKGGTTVDGVIANLDIAPTVLDVAGLRLPGHLQGRSIVPLAQGKTTDWRDSLLYEYYWERNFPQTPTIHALRGDKYKYIHYQGIWDIDELYDLQADPFEMRNLIFSPEHASVIKEMKDKLFSTLIDTGGMYIPLYPDRGSQQNLRRRTGSKPADFPEKLMRNKDGRN